MEPQNFYQSFFYKFSVFSGVVNAIIAAIFLCFAFVIPPTPASGVLGLMVSTVFVLPALAITVIGSLIILLVTVLKKKQYTYTKPTKEQIFPISLYLFFIFALFYWINSATELKLWFFAIGIPCGILLFYNAYIITNMFANKAIKHLETMKSFADTFTCKLACLSAIISLAIRALSFIELPFAFINAYNYILIALATAIIITYFYERKHNAPIDIKPSILNLKNITIYALVLFKTIYAPIMLFWGYVKLFWQHTNVIINPTILIDIAIFAIFIHLFCKQLKK